MKRTPPRNTTLGVKVTQEVSDTVDMVADRLSITRSEAAWIALRNGAEEMAGITKAAEHPLINFVMRTCMTLAADEDEKQEIIQKLDAVKDYRKARNQKPLPGIES